MSNNVPPPIATLRGHHVGVTSLVDYIDSENPYLVSGDEEGSLIIWDLTIFRKLLIYRKLMKSRVQSLRTVYLTVEGERRLILVSQSRDNGILLLDLHQATCEQTEPKIIADYPTIESLFSRGDAKNIDNEKAALAYPSCIENHLVTVRIIGPNAETLLSGSAHRFPKDYAGRSCNVFDIRLVEAGSDQHTLLVAYEDGCLAVFTFNLNKTETIPILNSTGLKLDLIRTLDLKIAEFMSSFDVMISNPGDQLFTIVAGSPLDKLIFLRYEFSSSTFETEQVTLRRPGVSTIAVRPDRKLVAVGCWDATIKLYSMKTRKILASLKHHTKQAQDLLFIDKQFIHKYSEPKPPSNLETGERNASSYFLCCASMEGTISISEIY